MSKVRTSLSSDSGDTISLARDTWPGWLDTAVRYAAFSRLISRAYIIPSGTPLVAELVALLVLGAVAHRMLDGKSNEAAELFSARDTQHLASDKKGESAYNAGVGANKSHDVWQWNEQMLVRPLEAQN